jgi:hypothetical protein
MLDYKKYLENKTVPQLKQIIKEYKLDNIINISKRRKNDLMEDIMKHTTLKKSGIYRNNENLLFVKQKQNVENNFNQNEIEILKRLSINKNIVDDYEINKKEKNDDYTNAYKEYRKAFNDYRIFKLGH